MAEAGWRCLAAAGLAGLTPVSPDHIPGVMTRCTGFNRALGERAQERVGADLGAPRYWGDPRGRTNRRKKNVPGLTGGAKYIPPPVCRAGGLEEKKTPTGSGVQKLNNNYIRK